LIRRLGVDNENERFIHLWNSMIGLTVMVMNRLDIGLSDEDAWQEARIALLRAMRDYNPERGNRFTTVYYTYLKNALLDYIHMIRFNTHYNKRNYSRSTPLFVSLFDTVVTKDEEYLEEHTLLDTIADPEDRLARVEEQLDAVMEVEKLLSGLNDRDRSMLIMRFGLNGEEPMTYRQIGDRLGLTRERIRQRMNELVYRIRKNSD
jgi:RNA polymerase sigma factor (sigma-70 family)